MRYRTSFYFKFFLKLFSCYATPLVFLGFSRPWESFAKIKSYLELENLWLVIVQSCCLLVICQLQLASHSAVSNATLPSLRKAPATHIIPAPGSNAIWCGIMSLPGPGKRRRKIHFLSIVAWNIQFFQFEWLLENLKKSITSCGDTEVKQAPASQSLFFNSYSTSCTPAADVCVLNTLPSHKTAVTVCVWVLSFTASNPQARFMHFSDKPPRVPKNGFT